MADGVPRGGIFGRGLDGDVAPAQTIAPGSGPGLLKVAVIVTIAPRH